MEHRSEEFRVQCGMSESSLKTVPFVVCTLGMYLGRSKLFIRWSVVLELIIEGAVQIYFEDGDNEDGRNSRDPVKRSKPKLKTNS